MRPTTQIAIALKHVGKANESPHCFSGSLVECLKQLTQYLITTTMATRFDVCIARSPEEAMGQLSREGGKKALVTQELFDMFDSITNASPEDEDAGKDS